jgi:hypothetical protein
VSQVTKSTNPTTSTEPSESARIAIRNIKRLNALAGKLQWESGGERKFIDDAIDYLFDCLEKKEKSHES